MSRINDLIQELCPDGVEFKMLGDIIRIDFGARITKSKDTGTIYPVYGGGGESFRTDSYNREDQWVISRFAMSENCVRWVDGRFWMLDSGFTFDVAVPGLDKDFVGQSLLNVQPTIFATSTQSAQKNIDIAGFKRLRIPIPPLEVQQEIVRVLDLFQALEAELEAKLEAELGARRRQYAHYRDSLLSFSKSSSVKWQKMGEVGEFVRGRRFTKNDVVDEGIPSIHYGEIYTTYGIAAHEAASHVREDLAHKLRYAKPGDVVIAAVGETVEDVGRGVAWLGTTDVAIHDDCFLYRSGVLNPKFVSYYLRTEPHIREKAKYVARAKVKRMSGAGLAKLPIPVPSLKEQERIVAILDELANLLADLAVALPAEVIARRQQYEFYRHHLLTFEELSA